MAIGFTQLNGNLVIRDDDRPWRLYDGWGPNVTKYIQDFATIPSDDTSGDPTEWEVTVVEVGAGTSTAVVTDRAGGALLVTTAGNEDDGWSMQLGAAAGESVLFDGGYPCYVGIRFAINDVDQTDILFGLSVTDTAMLGGVTDGIYFRSVDESATLSFVLEKDSVESTTTAATLVDGVYITCEFYYDGQYVTAYVNGSEIAKVADTSTSFPDNEEMRLSFEFLTGEATANTCTIEWMRFVYVRA